MSHDDRATRDTEPAPPMEPTPLGELLGSIMAEAVRVHEGGADGLASAPEWSGADLHAPGPSLVRLGALPEVLEVLGIRCERRRSKDITRLAPGWVGRLGEVTIVVVWNKPNRLIGDKRWCVSYMRGHNLERVGRGETFEQARDDLRGRLGLAVAS